MASPPDTPLPALLRAALEERRVSVKELARRLSSDAGTAVESERRGLQRYLKGEVTPEPEKAAAIARQLDKPEEQFVQTARLQRSIPELLLEIDARLETLAAELRSRDTKTRGSRQPDRLRTLERRMEEQGKAVRDSLAAILKILEQRRERSASEIAFRSASQSSEGVLMQTITNGISDSKRRWIAASILPILLALTVAGGASAKGWVWPRAYAESKLVSEYETTDPWALRDAREQLAADLGTGFPGSSTRIRHDRQDIAAAGRAASPLWAHCKGVGRNDGGGYFARFWCRVRLTSLMSQYEATRAFTLVVRGRQAFRVLFGWH